MAFYQLQNNADVKEKNRPIKPKLAACFMISQDRGSLETAQFTENNHKITVFVAINYRTHQLEIPYSLQTGNHLCKLLS